LENRKKHVLWSKLVSEFIRGLWKREFIESPFVMTPMKWPKNSMVWALIWTFGFYFFTNVSKLYPNFLWLISVSEV
jgi:hypothetical protein